MPLQIRADFEPLNQKLCLDTQIEAYLNQKISAALAKALGAVQL